MPNPQVTEPVPQSPYDRNVELTPLNTKVNGTRQRMTDPDQVIRDSQRLVEATPNNHSDRAKRLYNLALRLDKRYKQAGQIDDSDLAIRCYNQAVEIIPDGHPDRAWIFQELGASLGDRYHNTKQLDDLEQAIEYFQKAVKATKASPEKHQERARRLAGIGAGLRDRYKQTNCINDIEQAIQCYRRAIEATPHDHPDRARRWQELGAGLKDLYQGTGRAADLHESVEAFKASCFDPFGQPIIRIDSGKQAAQILGEEQIWEDSSHVQDEVLRLLRQVTCPTDSREKWQKTLATFSGLAARAASVHLKAGRSPLEALQTLENGRGIIASLMMDVRWDLSRLQDINPFLWQVYKEMGDQLAAFNNGDAPVTSVEQKKHRRFTFEKLNELQSKIRHCAGYERFLLPLTEEEITGLAQDGPLVCFNVSDISSEVFLVTTTGVQVLHLPDLKENDIRRGLRIFASRGNRPRRDASLCDSDEEEEASTSDLTGELASIWKHAVRPVLEQLGLLGQIEPPQRLPRIWWVGGGLMALVPLHAAGEHITGSTENTLSHVISSYVPTLKALQYSRSKPKPHFTYMDSRSRLKMVIISMPTTPEGYKTLRLTEEVAAVREQGEDSEANITSLDRPSRESALKALKSCNIAHLACHATADQLQPTQSALLLGRNVLERLTVEDIMKMDFDTHGHAPVAYLSACSTAETKVQNLADESIHLASAFQLAGFMHVVGTLWAADDDAAVEIAGKFYEGLELYDRQLFDQRESGSVAYALHYAVLHYRSIPGSSMAVAKWAPFIHLGC